MLKALREAPSALTTFAPLTIETRDRKAGSASGIALLIHETNFTRGSRKKCLENLIVAHKKAPRETTEGHCKEGKKDAENGGKREQTNNASKITACQAPQRAPFQGNAFACYLSLWPKD
jgi:hypothetical protein